MPGSIAEALGNQRYAAAVLYIVCMAKSFSSRKTRAKKRSKARLVSSKTVYRGPVFWVTTDHVEEPGGVKARRDIVRHSGSVVVLAVDNSPSIPRVLLERNTVMLPGIISGNYLRDALIRGKRN